MIKDYNTAKKTFTALREAWPKFLEIRKNLRCDKYGFGFNKDDRFSAWSVKVSLDNWSGYYGSSSCSNAVRFGDEGLVREYFVKWLNGNFPTIFKQMADMIESDAQVAKEARIATLKEELSKLESTEEQA